MNPPYDYMDNEPTIQSPNHGRGGYRHANSEPARVSGLPEGRPPVRRPMPTNRPEPGSMVQVEGILEIHPQGYGFLRHPDMNFQSTLEDCYVGIEVIRKHQLRGGEIVVGEIQPAPPQYSNRPDQNYYPRRGRGPQPMQSRRPQGPRLQRLLSIEGLSPEEYSLIPAFDRLTAVDPTSWLNLETAGDRMTTRVIDLFTPIGRGQRGLIVAPPRSGKTVLMQHMAEAISQNHPDVELLVLLIDERPEEVTEIRRSVRGTVYASSNDRESSSHARLAHLVIERAKRRVELGKHVVILLDSITRLARAYNKNVGSTGRTMSGGLDVRALDVPKRLFGSARAFDEGGSLTVIATALIETGSRMDEVIFQEFKGTGNMELVLDRKLSDRRVYPAIDLLQSGTRKEERLLSAEMLKSVSHVRRALASMRSIEAMESLLRQLSKYKSNEEFLQNIERVTG